MSFTDEKCLATRGRYSLERGINAHLDRRSVSAIQDRPSIWQGGLGRR